MINDENAAPANGVSALCLLAKKIDGPLAASTARSSADTDAVVQFENKKRKAEEVDDAESDDEQDKKQNVCCDCQVKTTKYVLATRVKSEALQKYRCTPCNSFRGKRNRVCLHRDDLQEAWSGLGGDRKKEFPLANRNLMIADVASNIEALVEENQIKVIPLVILL